jgi:peptidoglycan/LPS O-acetylase OafA/YrhL
MKVAMMHAPASDSQHPPRRIEFAQTLRGLACFVVVISHLVIMAGAKPGLIAELTGLNYPTRESSFLAAVDRHSPFSLGPLGVAVFFLVSGMVIPLSLGRMDRFAFLVARFFRLVPTYAFCLLITMTALFAAYKLFGLDYKYPWKDALLHVALVRDIAWMRPIDGVVWTLEIEGRFYLACMLLAPLIRAGDFRGILIANAIITAIVVWVGPLPIELATANLRWFALLNAMSLSAMCIGFMWIGTIFCFHWQGRCTTKQALVAILLLDAMFLAQLYGGAATPASMHHVLCVSYQLALILFAAGYLAPPRMVQSVWLDRIAEISYPLYAVHAMVGYAIIQIVFHATGNLYLGMFVACAAAFALAIPIHFYIERPSQEFGRVLAKRINRLDAPPKPEVISIPKTTPRRAAA